MSERSVHATEHGTALLTPKVCRITQNHAANNFRLAAMMQKLHGVLDCELSDMVLIVHSEIVQIYDQDLPVSIRRPRKLSMIHHTTCYLWSSSRKCGFPSLVSEADAVPEINSLINWRREVMETT